jgi:hypothetical protein
MRGMGTNAFPSRGGSIVPSDAPDAREPSRYTLSEGNDPRRMMGNGYFLVARLGIPLHPFIDEARAIEWLKGDLE